MNTQLKARIILGSIVIVVLIIFYWVATHAFLKVTVVGNGTSTITLTKQGTTQSRKIILKGGSGSILVSRASYEVLVQQGSLSSFQPAVAKGFLQTTQVSATPVPQLGRSFVGNNPAQCMNLLGTVLFSNNCNGINSKVNVHVPATADQPTYTTADPNGLGVLKSNTTIKAGDLALYAAPPTSPDGSPSAQTVYLYRMAGTRLQVIDQAKLSNLSNTTLYTIKPYLDGFVAYDGSLNHIWYYTSIHAQPSELTINQPKLTGAQAYQFSSNSTGTYTVAYVLLPHTTSTYATRGGKIQTEIDLYNNGSTQSFILNGQYSDVALCGTDHLCLLADDSLLTVNQIQGSKLKVLLSMANITSMTVSDEGLMAVRPPNAILINPDTLSGSIAYSMGNYTYCGLETTSNGFIICTGQGSTKSALYLSQSLSDTAIDRQIATLRQSSDISNVSINGPYIFITPVGSSSATVYDPATNSYGPDPTIQANLTRSIDSEIDKAGISRTTYTVVISAPIQ